MDADKNCLALLKKRIFFTAGTVVAEESTVHLLVLVAFVALLCFTFCLDFLTQIF